MKQHAWAAIATLVMTVVPGAVLAGTVTTTGRVASYSEASATLMVSSNALSVEKLQILPATRFIGCPDLLTAGCRSVAERWNMGVLQNQPAEYFHKLLPELGANSCNVEYTRGDVPDTNGAYGAVNVRPAP